MIITKLKRTKRANRVSIFIDGKFAFSVPRKLISEYALYQGKEISERFIHTLKLHAHVITYTDLVSKLIIRRPRSEKEVRMYLYRKIRRKDDREVLIENIVGELRQKGMINDKEFALWWVQNRIAFKPRGEFLLKSELVKKGVKKDSIAYALDAAYYEAYAEKMALDVGRKKARQLGTLKDKQSMRKLIAFLMRKGFSYSTAKNVYNRLIK